MFLFCFFYSVVKLAIWEDVLDEYIQSIRWVPEVNGTSFWSHRWYLLDVQIQSSTLILYFVGTLVPVIIGFDFQLHSINKYSHNECHLSATWQWNRSLLTFLSTPDRKSDRLRFNNRKKLPKHWYNSINFRQEFAKE